MSIQISVWIWLAAMVLFGVAEALTVGLVSIWFAAGSLAALVVSALDGPIWLQVALFAAVSAAALALARPLARKFTRPGVIPTNADRVLGQPAQVTETIDNEQSSGAVYVDGKTWTARSAEGGVIPQGERVIVERMEGVKLFVRFCEKAEAVR